MKIVLQLIFLQLYTASSYAERRAELGHRSRVDAIFD